MDSNWNAKIRLLGFWWLADKPDARVPGCLEIADGKIRLELIGTVENELFEDLSSQPRVHPIVLGIAQGKYFTLVDCRTIGCTQSVGGDSSPVSKVDATFAIEGAHFRVREKLQFKEVILRYYYLEDWIQDCPVIRKYPNENDRNFTRQFVLPDDRRFTSTIDESVLTVSSEYNLTLMGRDDHFRFRNTVGISTPESKELSWFVERADCICDLLSFLIGERTAIASFQPILTCNSHAQDRILNLFASHWVFIPTANNLHPLEMRYGYPMIADRITKMLDFWLGRSDQLATAFDLITGAQQDKDLPVRFQFLNYVHALECLDRARGQRGYMSPEDYEQVRHAISTHIPKELESGHRDSIKRKIEFGYEYSLRKRITEMLKELPENLSLMVCKNSSAFPGLIADTRNYFAHYTLELKEKAVLAPRGLFWFSQQLSIWCTAELLLQMGFTSIEVEYGLRRCPTLQLSVEHGPEF